MTTPIEERKRWTCASGASAVLVEPTDTLPPVTPGATEVLLVRHTETDWNRDGRCQGLSETALNASGISQARALSPLVTNAGIVAAYSSPLGRAVETARLLLAGSGLAATQIPDLHEVDYGRLTGLAPAEWSAIDPTLEHRWHESPWDLEFPGGERLSTVHARVTRAWDALVATHRGQRILVVGHGHANRLLVLHAVGADPRLFWTVPQPNGALWHVRVPPAKSYH